MTNRFTKGSKVSWNSHGGKARGKVLDTVTAPMRIGKHKVAASPDNPEVLVETGEGKRAAHKPSALRKI